MSPERLPGDFSRMLMNNVRAPHDQSNHISVTARLRPRGASYLLQRDADGPAGSHSRLTYATGSLMAHNV